MSYLHSGLAVRNADFRTRITACLYHLSVNVRNEDPATPDHAVRLALAEGILQQYTFPIEDFVWTAATNPTIAATITMNVDGTLTVGATDSDIELVCSSNYTAIALRRHG